ncbi:VOC family protein [uncultured Shimia sp.]|uniref:VOC family protein n=1 Tax=uncultured Shimia sp. TaxID=573152 RepID=UPI00262CE56C|nr:VOC family protein [uncultured Shimia sp.]
MTPSQPSLRGVNHITLVCADLNRSISFYTNALNATLRAKWTRGAYVEIGPLWLCLEQGHPTRRDDDSHVALDCAQEDFEALSAQISARALLWKDNTSEGASLYFLDPDGHKLELHVGSLETRLAEYFGRSDVTLY